MGLSSLFNWNGAEKAAEAKKTADAKKAADAKTIEKAKKFPDVKNAADSKKIEEAKKSADAKKSEEAKKATDAKKAAEDKKALDDYCNILAGRVVGDKFVSLESTIDQIFHLFSPPRNAKAGIVVWATKKHFSENMLTALKNYAREGFPVSFVVDRTIRQQSALFAKLEEFKKFPFVSVYYFSRAVSSTVRLMVALRGIGTEYVTVFSMNDFVNVRSYANALHDVLEDAKSPVLIPNYDSRCFAEAYLLENPSLQSLSGIIFNRKYLLEKLKVLDSHYDFFVPYVLYRNISKEDISEVELKKLHARNDVIDLSIPDIAYLFKNARMLIKDGYISRETVFEDAQHIISMVE